ncbi:MAG: folylpolyglutamate synthase/dihydrofolate synthase family protein [Bacteroidota bacterium]|nr:folylpolyglutamate synthase/dihydrofolate synthase family protein [Bacteroidota bacterium]
MTGYNSTIQWLYEQIPPYQFKGSDSYKPGLSRMKNFLSFLGNPQSNLKFIHVGGTNGKGSTSHMLSSILQEYDKKVGLFTSPHMFDFRERIKVNSNKIEKKTVIDFVERNKNYFLSKRNSFFEISFAMAISYFKNQKVDYAVIEVGLGGRLDATNVIHPLLSVITNIGLDHIKFLGDKITSIANEKAGIIKKNVPVLIGEKNKEIDEIFIEKAKRKSSKIFFTEDFSSSDFDLNLKTNYQRKNMSTAFAAIQILFGNKITNDIFKRGILNLRGNTLLRGRWEKVMNKPLVIADVAHNEEGFKEVISEINRIKAHKKIFVLGFVKDKPIEKIIKLFPKEGIYFFSSPKISRALSSKNLKLILKNTDINFEIFESIQEAYKRALNNASKEDFIFVGGSNFTVSEILNP